MNRLSKILGTLAMLSLPACTVLAEAAEPPMGMPPQPVIPTSFIMLVMLALTLDVLLIVAVAYVWMMWRQDHQAMKQVSALSAELKELSKMLEGLKAPEPEEPEEKEPPVYKPDLPEPPGPPMKKEVVWKPFVEEFNKFAAGMKNPGSEGACERFVNENKIKLLMCLDHAAMENNMPAPKFTEVKSVPVSGFWAYPLPDVADRYAVVPNPMIPYEQKIHEEGGMKETFASNFETGVYRTIIVKMPALMHFDGGRWVIDQPGMIRVEP